MKRGLYLAAGCALVGLVGLIYWGFHSIGTARATAGLQKFDAIVQSVETGDSTQIVISYAQDDDGMAYRTSVVTGALGPDVQSGDPLIVWTAPNAPSEVYFVQDTSSQVFGPLFLLSLVITLIGSGAAYYIIWDDQRRRSAIRDACQTLALVTRIEDVRNGYVIHYEFRDVTGFRREGESQVLESYPGYSLSPGKPVKIVYSSTRPERSELLFENPYLSEQF